MRERKRLPPYTHTLNMYWLSVRKCAQYGEESLGCRAEVFNFRIKCSLYEMLLTSSRPLLPEGGGRRRAASSQQRWLRRMAECSVEQALESQLYSRLAYCCVRPSLSPFVSLDFPSPQAPQLMPASPDATTGNVSWRPSESRPLMRPPPPPVNTTFTTRPQLSI